MAWGKKLMTSLAVKAQMLWYLDSCQMGEGSLCERCMDDPTMLVVLQMQWVW